MNNPITKFLLDYPGTRIELTYLPARSDDTEKMARISLVNAGDSISKVIPARVLREDDLLAYVLDDMMDFI